MKSRIIGSLLVVVGIISLGFALWGYVKRNTPPDQTLLLIATALICLGVAVFIEAYPERIEIGKLTITLRAPVLLDSISPPPPGATRKQMSPEARQHRISYTSARVIPGDTAAPFDILAENALFSLLPSSQPTTPMYLLDKEYRILDWNDAFTLAFDATMEGLRGYSVTEWVYFLTNWKSVVDHGIKVFGDFDKTPRIDVEQVEYDSERYGAFKAAKRAYQIPDDSGNVRGWLIILDVAFSDQEKNNTYNLDLIQRLRNNLMWSEYAVSYDHILNATEVYPELLDTMIGNKGPMPEIDDDATILDLGAGTGNLTWKLANGENKRVIFAVENNRIMFNMLRQKCRNVLRSDHRGPGVIAVKQDIYSLYGLPDEFFNVAILNNVLYSLDDPAPCLSEVYRVLQQGGEIRISGPRKGTKLDKLFSRIKRDLMSHKGRFEELRSHYKRVELINRVMLSPSLYRWDAEDVCKLLTEAGFSSTEIVSERAYAGQSMIVRAIK